VDRDRVDRDWLLALSCRHPLWVCGQRGGRVIQAVKSLQMLSQLPSTTCKTHAWQDGGACVGAPCLMLGCVGGGVAMLGRWITSGTCWLL
jgi:hypothetical protein